MENDFTAGFFLAEHEATNTWLGTRHGGLSLIADVNVNVHMITLHLSNLMMSWLTRAFDV